MSLVNVYYLECAIIQYIPAISPLGPTTSIIPFVILISVSLIREGYEYCKKENLNKEQNSESVEAYRNGEWECVNNSELEIDELVEVKMNIESSLLI